MGADTVPGTGHAIQQDPDFYTKRVLALYPRTATAAVGAGTELDGDAIDRCNPNVALAANVVAPARVTLASGHDVVVSRGIDHRDSSADPWENYDGAAPEDVTITANNDGSPQDVDLGFGVDLSGAKVEIRVKFTPDFSASGVDTVVLGASVVLGGFDTNPAG